MGVLKCYPSCFPPSPPAPSVFGLTSPCPLPLPAPAPSSLLLLHTTPSLPHRLPALHVMAELGNGGLSNGPSPARKPQSPFSAIEFLMVCQKLKTTKRAGWVNHQVKESESIADHMYRMAVMAIIASDVPGVSKDRCVKMAVVHDIAEAIVGDITPADNVPKAKKSAMERAAIEHMCDVLGEGPAAEEVMELWSEYEDNLTPEAKLVKDFDKVELILQALEYEKVQGKNLDDFFRTTEGKFQTDLGKVWAAEVVSRRPSFARVEPESTNSAHPPSH